MNDKPAKPANNSPFSDAAQALNQAMNALIKEFIMASGNAVDIESDKRYAARITAAAGGELVYVLMLHTTYWVSKIEKLSTQSDKPEEYRQLLLDLIDAAGADSQLNLARELADAAKDAQVRDEILDAMSKAVKKTDVIH